MAKLIEKGEHNHKLTDIIKVLIFTLILLLPGIVFLPTCLYYSINKYATNTTTTEVVYKYESNQINTLDDLVEGNIYFSDELLIAWQDFNDDCEFYIVKVDDITATQTIDSWIDETFVENYSSKDNNYIHCYYEYDNTLYIDYSNQNGYVSEGLEQFIVRFTNVTFYIGNGYLDTFKYFLQNNNYLPQYTDFNVIDHVNENVDDTITHKIAKAYTDTWNEPLFNWTNNTPFNTGLNNFIAIFGITSESKIANTLIYILTITAIYVIFDIIIATFKWVTHIFTSK